MVIRQRGRLHGQGRAAGDSTQRGRDGGAAGIDGGGEAGAINSGHTRARGRPRDLASQVLRAAIGISPGGGEWLRGPRRNRGGGRCHRNGRKAVQG